MNFIINVSNDPVTFRRCEQGSGPGVKPNLCASRVQLAIEKMRETCVIRERCRHSTNLLMFLSDGAATLKHT